jgi:hypothetical protein
MNSSCFNPSCEVVLQKVPINNYLNDNSYYLTNSFIFASDINVQIYEKAWKIAKKKFLSLRSKFSWRDIHLQIIEKYNENFKFFKSLKEVL